MKAQRRKLTQQATLGIGAAVCAVSGILPSSSLKAQTGTGGAAGGANSSRRIAVLLPPATGDYRRATSSVLAGLRAALARDGQGFSFEVLSVDERLDSLSNALREAQGKGCGLAIGPLTRTSVGQLGELASIPMPVLALNWPDNERFSVANTVYFGLPIESEAKHAARYAFSEASNSSQRRPLKASTISGLSPLARRAAQAFAESWREQGGVIGEQIETETRLSGEMRSLMSQAEQDVCYLATSIDTARSAKSNLPKDVALYAPSLLSTGVTAANLAQSAVARTPELDGIRVTELPWLIQNDHPAVMSYPRQATLGHQELQRLYARGIDAFRIAKELLAGNSNFEIDGVSGVLKLDKANDTRIQFTPAIAEYRSGVLVPLGKRS